MQPVTASPTRYRTFSLTLTWVNHNATCYRNFNVLVHALPYIFSQCIMVWGYLQHVTARHRQIYNIYIYVYKYFFQKIDGNAWQRVANSPKPGKSQRKYTVMRVVTRVVTHSSYGNTLH